MYGVYPSDIHILRYLTLRVLSHSTSYLLQLSQLIYVKLNHC